ncbi:MAG: class I SAM-dependent methyltransferase [Candidatus Micrarchaeota archaeon]|nr:class I SAM-dependent methyltransferase [Candidatus Micrarchaeota archaeon]
MSVTWTVTNEDIAPKSPLLRAIYWKLYARIFPNVVILLRRELEGCKSFLELGCGMNSPVRFFSKEFKSAGVDIYKPYLEESRRRGIHDEYFLMDIRKLKFTPKSYDAVLALDLIEHFTKKEGEKLLKEMERIARKRVIVYTPNGFLKQADLDGNKFQIHKSGWTVSEMKKRGYRVIGVNGAKFLQGRGRIAHLRGVGALNQYVYFLWWMFSDITQLFTYHFPDHAFQLICVKEACKRA